MSSSTKVVVVGAGPVGSLAALYAAQRGYDVEIYELRNGETLSREEEIFPSGHLDKPVHFSHKPAYPVVLCFLCPCRDPGPYYPESLG